MGDGGWKGAGILGGKRKLATLAAGAPGQKLNHGMLRILKAWRFYQKEDSQPLALMRTSVLLRQRPRCLFEAIAMEGLIIAAFISLL